MVELTIASMYRGAKTIFPVGFAFRYAASSNLGVKELDDFGISTRNRSREETGRDGKRREETWSKKFHLVTAAKMGDAFNSRGLQMSTDVTLTTSHAQSPWHWLLGCKFRQDTRTKASVGSQDSRVRAIALTLKGNLQDHRCLAPSGRDLIDWYSPRPGNTSPSRGLECRVIGSDPERTPACLRSTPRGTTDRGRESSPPAPQSWRSQGGGPLRRGRKPSRLPLPNLEKIMCMLRRPRPVPMAGAALGTTQTPLLGSHECPQPEGHRRCAKLYNYYQYLICKYIIICIRYL